VKEKEQYNTKTKKVFRAKRFFFFVLILCLFFGTYFLGYSSGIKGYNLNIGAINTNKGKPNDVDFSLFWQAWNDLKSKSADNPDNQKMLEGAINGMLSSVNDPYTVYFTKDQNKQFTEDLSGQFSGVGIELVQKNNLPTVVAPLSDSPAEKAGVKANDIILQVDGAKTSDIGFGETITKIRGEVGSKVTLLIQREGVTDPITIEIVRSTITVKSVEWKTIDSNNKNIFYIKVRQFGDDTEGLFDQAVAEAVKVNPEGVVIDLRDNPGGYLETAVNIASDFVDNGVVVSEKGTEGNKDYKASGKAQLKNYKVDILVNGGSASASEILSGALRDRLGSKLIGEKTFGKGSVQELINLSDGSAAKITVAKWYTPSGAQIGGTGLSPDIQISNVDNSTVDAQLNRAVDYLISGK
jgi:carboxyl-terminal processing protease